MSIETDTWGVEQESASTYSIRTSMGELQASGEHAEELLERVVVLPEALALLKQYVDEEGIDENCVRDLLRRAGVLK